MSTESAPSRDATRRLCILVPVFNEAPVLRLLMPRLDAALATIDAAVSVLFIDDGSTDATPPMPSRLASSSSQTVNGLP